MTQPAFDTDEQLTGRAAAAVADIQDELAHRYTGLNTAEAHLAEALLTAHATSEAGRQRLQGIQRQMVEAIINPVNALDTPAGERQFLMFLRTKVAEIQRVVDDGVLTASGQAELTRALADGYLTDDPTPVASVPMVAAAAPAAQPAAAGPGGGMPTMSPAFGGLPQSAPGSLGAATSPLAGLSSLLDGHDRDPDEPEHDETGSDDDDDVRHDDAPPAEDDAAAPPEDATPDESGPAKTRPAAS